MLARNGGGLQAFARRDVQRARNQRDGHRVKQQRLPVGGRRGTCLDRQRRVVGGLRVDGLERTRDDDRGRDGRGQVARAVRSRIRQDGECLQASGRDLGVRVDRENVRDGEHIASLQAVCRSGSPAIGDQRLRPSILGCRIGHGLRAAVDQRGAAQGADGMGRREHGFVVHETGVLADRGFFQSLLVVAVHIGALNQGRKLGRDERAVERLAPTSGVAAVSEDRASVGKGGIGRRGGARSAIEPVEGRIERGDGRLDLLRRAPRHRLQDLLRIAVKRQGPVKRADGHLVRPSLVHLHGDGALGDVLREGRQVKVVVLA